MTSHEIALSYLNAFSSGNPDAVASHVSEDFENNQVGLLGTGCKGRKVYRRKLVDFLTTFQNIRYTPEDFIDDGDRVAVAYRMNAEDNSRPIEIHGVMMITISNGLISVRSDYWDGLSYLKQTGVEIPVAVVAPT